MLGLGIRQFQKTEQSKVNTRDYTGANGLNPKMEFIVV